jgi:VIT1/CCC1 family predicted Fe2+/Mn2+ transporter
MKDKINEHFQTREYLESGTGASAGLRAIGVLVVIVAVIVLFTSKQDIILIVIAGLFLLAITVGFSSTIDLLVDIKYELIYNRLKNAEEKPKQTDAENA